MARELLVDERVIGVEQLEHTPVLAQRAANEQLGFTLERIHQREVVVWIALGIDDDFGHAPKVEPLRREVVDERIGRARIGEHALHLPLEHERIAQLALFGKREQLIVGDAGPQKK